MTPPNTSANVYWWTGNTPFMLRDLMRMIFLLRLPKDLTPELLELASWAYIMQGNSLSEQAKTKTGEDADRLFALAGEKYQAALKIKPDKDEALNSWGIALYDQAKTKTGEDA